MWTISDAIQLSKKLNYSKLLNASKMYAGFQYSQFTRKVVAPPLPFSMAIEPTTSCNLRCPQCISGKRDFTRPTGMLDNLLFKNIVDQTAHHLLYLTFYFQGEPFLHPQFTDMVSYATKKKIYTATSTNAHYLTDDNARKTVESGLNRMIISIDGVNQDTYSNYRVGGELEKVKNGIENIVKWKKKLNSNTPQVVLQFIVFKHNEHEVDKFIAFAKQSGADNYVLKSAQIYDFENADELLPINKKYRRYNENNRTSAENNNKCWKMWHSCVITWDGKIVPCCFDKDANHVMGNVNELPFSEIWHGEKYQEFRKKLFTARNEIEMCANCSEGSKVWVT